MVNLKDFLRGDESLHTKAFQQAVDYCSERGGEPLFVPFGTYTLSTVELKDNTTIIFEDNTTILGSKNLDDFYQDCRLNDYQDLSHSSYTKSLFYAKNRKNITIKGHATLDMQGVWEVENLRNSYYRGAKCIAFDNVEGVTLNDFKVLNATDVAILLGRCKKCIISGLYLHTHIDGISPDGCEDVVVTNCILNCGDDAFVIKSSLYDNKFTPCKRITLTNCTISSNCNAVKIGTETNGEIKYITVSNCVLYNTRCAGLSVESVDGSDVSGILFDNITMENVSTPIFINAGIRMRAPKGTPHGKINDVIISNIYADIHDKPYKTIDHWYTRIAPGSDIRTNFSIASSISNNTDNKMTNITLTNINCKVLGGKKLSEVDFKENKEGYPTPEIYGKVLPAYGLFIKNVDDIHLENVKFTAINEDERPEIVKM